jgi:hypothetical protein
MVVFAVKLTVALYPALIKPASDLIGPAKVDCAIIFSPEKISPIVLACLLGQSIGQNYPR